MSWTIASRKVWRGLLMPALTAIILVFVTALSAQNQGRWVRLAPIPEANEEFDSTVVNGKLYLFGGNPVATAGKQGAPPGLVY